MGKAETFVLEEPLRLSREKRQTGRRSGFEISVDKRGGDISCFQKGRWKSSGKAPVPCRLSKKLCKAGLKERSSAVGHA